jgi:hypothetical protein
VSAVLRYVVAGDLVYAQGRTEYKVCAVHCVLLRSLDLLVGFFRKEVDLCHKVVSA